MRLSSRACSPSTLQKRVGEVLLVQILGRDGTHVLFHLDLLCAPLAADMRANAKRAACCLRGARIEAALPVALGLFAVGQLGNLYHHMLLAGMRSSEAPAPERWPSRQRPRMRSPRPQRRLSSRCRQRRTVCRAAICSSTRPRPITSLRLSRGSAWRSPPAAQCVPRHRRDGFVPLGPCGRVVGLV